MLIQHQDKQADSTTNALLNKDLIEVVPLVQSGRTKGLPSYRAVDEGLLAP